ncbi:MAG: potassium channel family protein [Candidatus Nanopelagicales bacterium]
MTNIDDQDPRDLASHNLRQAIYWSTGRMVAAIVGIIGAYCLVPLGADDLKLDVWPAAFLGLGLFVWVLVRQLRKIEHADYPVLRAAETIALFVALFLTIFAASAVAIETSTPGSFSEPLTRVDGFYYAVSTLATVGFGDIHPVSQSARLVAIVQMLGNLLLLGVAVRLVGHAVDRARRP